jgi:hydrogenase/urease accessory protein HupE
MTALRIGAYALVLSCSLSARAHAPTFAVYSKYEATVSDKDIAFVFALDKRSLLLLLEREIAHAPVDPKAVERYRPAFSTYVFDRFSVRNNGAECSHPDQLGRFFWDEPTYRVLAVTHFHCASPLAELTIRSLITHDMPTSHELVGDLQYRRALVRNFFYGDEVEAHVSLARLPQTGEPIGAAPRAHGRFSYVAMPDRERRYNGLAAAELGVTSSPVAALGVSRVATLRYFIGQGILHIFTGYDHILFILTLMLAVRSWRRLATIVTSFTVAHSITLVAATLGVVTLPARLAEPLIALSVLFVALDALLRPQANARPIVTFAFGLIHGFGLSNVLRELGLSGRQLLPALFGFNVGVEIGQILIVSPLFWLVLRFRQEPRVYSRTRAMLCGSSAVLAALWLVLRVRAALNG